MASPHFRLFPTRILLHNLLRQERFREKMQKMIREGLHFSCLLANTKILRVSYDSNMTVTLRVSSLCSQQIFKKTSGNES